MQFQELIYQFKGTEGVVFQSLLSKEDEGMDVVFYELVTNRGILYVLELDYIGDFNTDVRDEVKSRRGNFSKIFEVKKSVGLEGASPFKSAFTYIDQGDWGTISIYANDQYGSRPYYYNFLVMP